MPCKKSLALVLSLEMERWLSATTVKEVDFCQPVLWSIRSLIQSLQLAQPRLTVKATQVQKRDGRRGFAKVRTVKSSRVSVLLSDFVGRASLLVSSFCGSPWIQIVL